VRLWPASLYGSLEELAERGFVEPLDAERSPDDESERKRFFRLTRAGRSLLTAETERLATVVRIARSRVKARAGEAG
jgi:DNA-binding PadR family transcriptional regulator